MKPLILHGNTAVNYIDILAGFGLALIINNGESHLVLARLKAW